MSSPSSKREPGVDVLLIRDEPSSSDAFDAKAHETVAQAIAELVSSEAGGKVLGLEGTWGAGKSTVIRLLRERLSSLASNGEETHIITIDAWAHQGDPLRRTFLESIINDFREKGWLTKERARAFVDGLAGRSSTVRTTSSARLSSEGIATAIAALFIPLGAALLGNDFARFHRPAQVVGAMLLVAPLFVVTSFTVAKAVGVLLRGQEKGGWRNKAANVNPFSFFAKEQTTNTTTEGIETGEPTSVEFEQIFARVLGAALNDNRRLLVVLDNIDRVDARDARDILSTLQTFTNSTTFAKTRWASRVWTLIPYDVHGLDRLWPDEPDRKRGRSTAAAFIEKLFQVRFQTPPLVLSDWRSHLRRLLKEALPLAANEEVEAILRLRAQYPGVAPDGVVAHEAPTPRELIQFVNQIGVGRRQRNDLPLSHAAYYVLLRRDEIDVPSSLLKGDLPHPGLSHVFERRVEDDLAAIHFGTTRELAQQLLLGGALEGALLKNDIEEVKGLMGRSGFVDALEQLDLASRLLDGGIELTRAVRVLEGAGAFALPAASSWMTSLRRIAKECPTWWLSGREGGVGLGVLAHECTESDEELIEFLGRIEKAAQAGDEQGQQQIEGVAGLIETLVQRGDIPEGLLIGISIPSDRLVRSIAHLKSATMDDRGLGLVDFGIGPDEVAIALLGAAATDDERFIVPALKVLRSRSGAVNLSKLAADTNQWLRENEPKSEGQLGVLLDILDIASDELGIQTTVRPVAEDGTLLHLVSTSNRGGWHAQSAAASLLHLMALPALPEPPSQRESSTGAQLLREVLADPNQAPALVKAQTEWFMQHRPDAMQTLMAAKATEAFRPSVNEHLKNLAEAEALEVDVEEFIANWSYLVPVLGDDGFARIVTNLIGAPGVLDGIVGGSNSPALAHKLLTMTIEGEARAQLLGWARGIVQSAGTETWSKALSRESGGFILKLAMVLADEPDPPSDPSGLSDALHSHFTSMMNTEKVWQPDASTFSKLTGLLTTEARHVLASEFCAALEGLAAELNPALLATYGPFLTEEEAFRTHQKLPNVVDRLVAHEDWDSIQWVVELAKKHRDTFRTRDRQKEMRFLKNKVKEKLEEAGDESPDALRDLGSALGLPRPEPQAEPSESES